MGLIRNITPKTLWDARVHFVIGLAVAGILFVLPGYFVAMAIWIAPLNFGTLLLVAGFAFYVFILDLHGMILEEWAQLQKMEQSEKRKRGNAARTSSQQITAIPAPQPTPTASSKSAPQKTTIPQYEANTAIRVRYKPHCADCGKPLVLRTNRLTQKKFWGCSGFPRCRYTRSLMSADVGADK
jgi:hypothetical protein